MQKAISIRMLIRQFSFVGISFLIFACSQNQPQHSDGFEKKNLLKPPVTSSGKAPIVTLLDTRPPPRTTIIPLKKEESFVLKINNSKTQIVPPDVKPADFMVLMHHYNTEHGLASGTVESGCIDKNGNLWFATNGGGVSRYDGKSFTNYTTTIGLVSNWATNVLEDKNGNVWIATGGGVSQYNGKFFTNYSIAQGLANNFVNRILEDKSGNLWFATQGGVSRYDGKDFKSFTATDGLANNWVTSILQDKSGNLWFGTADGASRYDGKTFKSYSIMKGPVKMYVTSIVEDKNGNLWFGTGGGVYRLDQDGSFNNYTPPIELIDKNISSIHLDKNGYLWFGTFGEGVFRLKEDGSITQFDSNHGLTNNSVGNIVEDNTGNLWFCTQDGISRFDQNGRFFVGYTTAQGLAHNSVLSFCEDKSGNLWFGTTTGGVSCLDRQRKTFTNYTTAQGLSGNTIRSIAEDKMGNLWFGTEDGICQLDRDRKVFKVYTSAQGLPENSTRWIKEDKMGNLWVCTRGSGVFRLDPMRKSIATYSIDQGLADNRVRDITEDSSGDLWFATVGGGISRFDQDSSSFTNYNTDQGLVHNNAWTMLEDKNDNLWIGTEAGLSRFDGISFTNYTTSDGLLDDAVDDIAIDKEGVIWFGSKGGFTTLKGFAQDKKQDPSHDGEVRSSNELSNVELKNDGFKPVFEIYNNKTGYLGKGIDVIGVSQDSIIWAGTGGFLGDKLISFDFTDVDKNPNPPAVFIQHLKIDNEIVSWYDLKPRGFSQDSKNEEELVDSLTAPPNIAEEGIVLGKLLNDEQRAIMREKFGDIKFDSITRFYLLPVNLELPYQHNNLTFDFVAIEPARPFRVHYQYMLEGYDKEWGPTTDQTTATFGNMPEGKYTFKVKAQSPDRVWSETVQYSFSVLPPWQRTWWAYTLYALVFLTALWIFISWRVRTLRKEKIVLEEKVSKRTHELQEEKEKVESTLTELRSTQALLIQSEKMASLGELTAGIAHEIQNPLNFVNNFSELNTELINELEEEANNGNIDNLKAIAKDIKDNEEKIVHHGKRADAIVKGMLLHSRTGSGVKEPTDINALVDEYLRLAYHGHRAKDNYFDVKMDTSFDGTIGSIKIVPQDIGRVILNLINNALYAVGEKKKVSAESYEPTITVTTKKENERITIAVRDNGNGIPKENLDKIFQPFFTTKPTGQGTGLGLSLSYDIIKAHGGELKAETKVGEGAEFVIQLPTSINV